MPQRYTSGGISITIAFWRNLHNYFLGSEVPDNSDINIDYLMYDAVLDYLYQNDVELQEEYEKELTDDIPY